jgi:hypothetical protein
MCWDICVDVHELARPQQETNDNLHHQSISLGHLFAPRSPDVPLHAPYPEVNDWQQQAYGVPFMSVADDDVEEDFIADDVDQSAPPPFKVIRAPLLLILLLLHKIQPAALLPLTLGMKTSL